jgi:photosystem II biogenesis protein Psp29
VSNVRTVSDTKRNFYNHLDRPVTSVYRRVVEELMVEMHLLSVSDTFTYDPIYALGIVTTYDTFMDGYRPEEHVNTIFTALCQSVESSPEQYRNDARQILDSVEGMSLEDLKRILSDLEGAPSDGLAGNLKAIAQREHFKYSRAFGIGLYTLLQKIDPELTKNREKLLEFMKELAEPLSISFDKLQKDIELYSSNIDKMAQAKIVMAEMLEADRKKREERAQAQAEEAKAKAAGDTDSSSSDDTDVTPVSTPSSESDEQPPQS